MAFKEGDKCWLNAVWLTKKDPNYNVSMLNLVEGYVLCTVIDKKQRSYQVSFEAGTSREFRWFGSKCLDFLEAVGNEASQI